MAARYWVGGGGTNWATAAHWAASSGGTGGQSVPTISDDVYFDTNSGGTFTATINAAASCRTLNASGCAVTFTGAFAITVNVALALDSNVVFTTTTVTFNGAASTNINFNGSYPTGGVTFSGAGTYTLLSNITPPTSTVSTTFTHGAGTIVFNNHSVSCGVWSSNISTARALDMSQPNDRINLIHPTNGTIVVNMATVTGLTTTLCPTATTGFYSDAGAGVSRTISYGSGGAASTNPINLVLTGAGPTVIGSSCTFNYIEINSTGGATAVATVFITPVAGSLYSGLVLPATGAWTNTTFSFTGSDTNPQKIVGNNASIFAVIVNRTGGVGVDIYGSFTITSALTLTAGAINFKQSGDSITTASFILSGSATRSINAQSSQTLSIGSRTYANAMYLSTPTAGATVLNCAATGGFSYTGSFCFATAMSTTRTFNWGGTSGSTGNTNLCPPMVFYSGASVATLGGATNYFSFVDFTGSTAPATGIMYAINVIFGISVTYSTLQLTVVNSGSTLNSNGSNFNALIIGSSTLPGTLTLADAAILTGASGVVNLNYGTLNLQGFSLTVAGSFTGIPSGSNTIAINFGGGRILCTTSTALQTNASIPTMTNFTNDQNGGFSAALNVGRTFGMGTTGATPANQVNFYFTSGAVAPTLGAGTGYKQIDWTGTTATLGTVTINCAGTTLASGGTYTGVTFVFNSTGTFNGGAKTIAGMNVNATGTVVANTVPSYGITLQSAVTVAASSVTLTAGTLNLAGYTLTISSTGTFILGAASTTGLLFGSSGRITITNTTAAATVVNAPTTTSLYTDWYNGTGGFSCTSTVARTFNIGGTAAGPYLCNLFFTSGASVPTFTGSGFGLVDFTGSTLNPGTVSLTCSGLTLASGGTYTGLTVTFKGTPPSSAVTGYSAACATFTPNGKPIVQMTVNALWTGSAGGATYTNYNSATVLGGAVTFTLGTATTYLTSGTLKVNGFTLTTGVFDYSNTNVASILFGGGTIALANTTGFAYVMNMPNLTNFTNDQNGGFSTALSVYRYFTCGTTGYVLQSQAASNISLTITSGVALPLFDSGCTFGYLDMSAVTYGVPAITLNVGAIKYAAGVGASPNFPPTFRYLWPTMTFTTGEATIGTTVVQPGSSSAPAFKIIGNLTVNGTLSLVQSANNAIDLNGYSITATNFTANANSNIGNIICTAANSTTSAINLSGSGNVWASNNITVMSNVRVNLTSTSDKAIDGNGNTIFGNVNNTGVGNLTIQNSDTFGNLNIVANPTTLTFTTGKQPVIGHLYANGISGSLVTINSGTPGTKANVQVTNPVSLDYVSISDINAVTTTWYAAANSINGGDNNNVVFSAAPTTNINGQFFAFY